MLSPTLLSMFHHKHPTPEESQTLRLQRQEFSFPAGKNQSLSLSRTCFPSFIHFIKSNFLNITLNANETPDEPKISKQDKTYRIVLNDGSRTIKSSPIGRIFEILRLDVYFDRIERMADNNTRTSCK